MYLLTSCSSRPKMKILDVFPLGQQIQDEVWFPKHILADRLTPEQSSSASRPLDSFSGSTPGPVNLYGAKRYPKGCRLASALAVS